MLTDKKTEVAIFNAMKSVVAPTKAKEVVAVCGWCPDAAEQTAAWRAKGMIVSHGLCLECAAKILGN